MKSPQTIQEYYNAFSKFLNSFFFEMINELYQKKTIVCNWQQRKYEKLFNITTSEHTTKIITFIISILLGVIFPYLKIWLPQVLSSLSHMPQLLGFFQQLLTICYVISHSDHYE